MVNFEFGFNLVSLMGIFLILISLPYFAMFISQLFVLMKTSNNTSQIAIKLSELLFIPTSLFVSGLILLYQGWRLDPILQFQQLLMIIISILLVRLYTK
ncbi:MAG TPA: Ycf66 family protein [Xenococcaceae cyanobacterium]